VKPLRIDATGRILKNNSRRQVVVCNHSFALITLLADMVAPKTKRRWHIIQRLLQKLQPVF
jgi:hypothetical protein